MVTTSVVVEYVFAKENISILNFDRGCSVMFQKNRIDNLYQNM